ncbi:MAG: glycosyltransferase family 4 protein [Ruminococcaceae bacterium]|nr:glycosyltransferase family 4 protein [Oscillospiraceae bacterium]
MKILHVDDTFHPNFGYQCNPLAKFQCKAGNEVYIISPEAKYIYGVYHSFGEYGEHLAEDDAKYEANTGVKIIRVRAKGYIMGRLNYYKKDLLNAINEINPDVILVHCMETLTAMYLMRKLRRKYPMAFDSHMLSMASKNKFSKLFDIGYKILFTSVIKKEKYTVIKTQNDDYVNKHLGVPENLSKFISFGTDVLLFSVDRDAKIRFLKEKELPENTFVITSTGKMTEAKAGKLFAKTVKEKFDGERPVAVVVVAEFTGDYEKQVKEELDNSKNKIFYYPVQQYTDLPYFYQIADVTVFPKQCSMSFYDAQSCGCPVISEKGHVNEERNSHGNGFCFECGSSEDFRRQIQKLIDMPEDEYEKMRTNSYEFVTKNYSYEDIASQYTEVLSDAIKNFNKKH